MGGLRVKAGDTYIVQVSEKTPGDRSIYVYGFVDGVQSSGFLKERAANGDIYSTYEELSAEALMVNLRDGTQLRKAVQGLTYMYHIDYRNWLAG